MLKKIHSLSTMLSILTLVLTLNSTLKAQVVMSQNWDKAYSIATTGWKTYESKFSKGTHAMWSLSSKKTGNDFDGFYTDTILPQSNPNMVMFNGYSCSPNNAVLISPSFDLSGRGTNPDTLVVLMYRDTVDGLKYDDSLRFWINTVDSLKGATLLGVRHAPSNIAPYGGGGAWNYVYLSFPAAYNKSTTNYIIIEGVSNNGPNIFIDDISWTAYSKNCTGTPSSGKAIATPNPLCGKGGYISLSDSGYSLDAGLSYKWESSTNGSSWIKMKGYYGSDTTVSMGYVSDTAKTMYYRIRVICRNSGDSAFSSVTVHVYPGPKTVSLPYFQGFENWFTSSCNTTTSTNDVPDSCYTQKNFTGDYSWRRDDQGSSSSWSNGSKGSYTPAYTQGSHSARFHGYNSTLSKTTVADLDMNFNMPKKGTVQINFDYNNYDLGYTYDSLKVLVSYAGYGYWTKIGAYGGTSAKGWKSAVATYSITYPGNYTLRFEASTPTGYSVNDVGIDSLNISVVPLGINEVSASVNKISVYPNPVSNMLTIRSEEYVKTPLYIYNTIGEVVYAAPLNGFETKVDMTTLPAGIYVVKLGNAVEKVIKY